MYDRRVSTQACFGCTPDQMMAAPPGQRHWECKHHGQNASPEERLVRVTGSGSGILGSQRRQHACGGGPGLSLGPPPPATGRGGGARLCSAAGVHTSARHRRAKPPEEREPARAGPSILGATSPAPAGGTAFPPPAPPLRRTTDEWLPPRAFLPPETPPPVPSCWSPWASSQGTPPRPRHSSAGPGAGSWDPQRALDDLRAAQAADRVYDSMDDLAAALHAQLATLKDLPEFRAWRRSHPEFKPRLSGSLMTAQGPRCITVLLDTGATHCFICARLAAALGLPPSGQPGPTSVMTAATGGSLGLAAPVC